MEMQYAYADHPSGVHESPVLHEESRFRRKTDERRKQAAHFALIRLTAFFITAAAVLFGFLILGPKVESIRRFYDRDFGLSPYVSRVDMNGDGIDDQTEILKEAKAYVASKPCYRSEYYETGYPTGNCGVCTDVVGYAMLHSGYDLMELVQEDVRRAPEAYPDASDARIDFRRVANLDVWFRRNAKYDLTTDIYDIGQWEGGDVVVFAGHIGIVSDRRNEKGIPYVIHHGRPGQTEYEEDILEYRDDVIAHYRLS